MIVAVSAEGPGLGAACSSNLGRCAVLSFADLDTLACESGPKQPLRQQAVRACRPHGPS